MVFFPPAIPKPTATSWSIEAVSPGDHTPAMSCALTSTNKPLGLCGATYKVEFKSTDVSLTLLLQDQLGLVMGATSPYSTWGTCTYIYSPCSTSEIVGSHAVHELKVRWTSITHGPSYLFHGLVYNRVN